MKKSDLRNFDIVETKYMELYAVNTDKRIIFRDYHWINLDEFSNDLKHIKDSDLDIKMVRRCKYEYQHSEKFWGKAPVIWERKEETE